MPMQASVLAIMLSLIVLSEQRPTILQDTEDVLLAAGRVERSLEDDVTTPGLAEEAPVRLLQASRVIRTVDYEDTTELTTTEDTASAEDTQSKSTESSSQLATTSEDVPSDFYGIFLQAVMRTPGDWVAKRSVEASYGDDAQVEDMDTAANTVFRPLFVYRQQNERRRRLRQLNVF